MVGNRNIKLVHCRRYRASVDSIILVVLPEVKDSLSLILVCLVENSLSILDPSFNLHEFKICIDILIGWDFQKRLAPCLQLLVLLLDSLYLFVVLLNDLISLLDQTRKLRVILSLVNGPPILILIVVAPISLITKGHSSYISKKTVLSRFHAPGTFFHLAVSTGASFWTYH